MAKCERVRFNRKKICAGDLRHTVQIKERRQRAALLGENEPQIEFVNVLTAKAGIQTLGGMFSGAALFSDVNIEDRPTHTFIFRRNQITENLEAGNNFLQLDQRYFRVLRRSIQDEDRNHVLVSCQERGDIEDSATEA